MIKVLFVCLGNICRSPSAEAVLKKKVEDRNLQDQFFIDSAGTSAHHEGGRADPRMCEHAKRRGIILTSISRPVSYPRDLKEFDYIIAMDNTNYRDLKSFDRSETYHPKVLKMADFIKKFTDVDHIPDPYFGGPEGFDHVLDLLDDACENFLEYCIEKHRL